MFVTVIGTMIPAIQFAGMLNPVSSLEGVGAWIGRIYPASYFLAISRGVFNKALGFASLQGDFWPLLLSVPVILALSIVLLKKAGDLSVPHLPNIYRLGVKELWSLVRDPIMLALIAYTFTVSIYIAATAMKETLNKAPIAIVDEDRSPLSERIAPPSIGRTSCPRPGSRCRPWMPAWTPATTPSSSIFHRTSNATCWRANRQPSNSMWTPRA
jgi:hypothetical protein